MKLLWKAKRHLTGTTDVSAPPESPHLGLHPSPAVCEEYCLNRLPPANAARLQEHLSVCKDCQTIIASTALLIELIKTAVASVSLTDNTGREQDGLALQKSCNSDLSAPHSDIAKTGADRSRLFTVEDIADARRRLGASHAAIARCLSALGQPTCDIKTVEDFVSADPALAAHLIRVTNCGLFARDHVRSVGRAVLQLGFERTRLHVLAFSFKTQFLSPRLKQVWNHSISVAGTARRLAEVSQAVEPNEACLAGLVHDIGRIILQNLGHRYDDSVAHLQAQDFNPVDIEWTLCGSSHASIGADLLEDWDFPVDLAEGVRQHHTPSLSNSPLSSLLYLAESWHDTNEDIYHPAEHSFARRFLGLTMDDIRGKRASHTADLEVLRMAAA